jgi:hypothetical protein
MIHGHIGANQSLGSTTLTRTYFRDYPDFTSAITVGLLHKDALGLSPVSKPPSHMQIELSLAPSTSRGEPTALTFEYDRDTKQYHCDIHPDGGLQV